MAKYYLFFMMLFITPTAIGQPIKLTVIIANPDSDTIQISNDAGFRHHIINKGGKFEGSFDAKSGFYHFYDGQAYSLMYLKPGFDLKMSLDAKNFIESITYSGKGAGENNFLASKAVINDNFDMSLGGSVRNNKFFHDRVAADKTKLLALLESGGIDPEFKVIMTDIIDAEAMDNLNMVKRNPALTELNGTASPSFSYADFEGGFTKTEDMRGKFIYIEVWAGWCAPCRDEIGAMRKIRQKYQGKNLEFVSISTDAPEKLEKWKKEVSARGLHGRQLFEGSNGGSEFMKGFLIDALPRFILLDPAGNIISANAWKPTDAELQEQLDMLLN